MNPRLFIKIISHLKANHQHKLVDKIYRAMSKGKAVSLTQKEQDVFNIVRHDLKLATRTTRDIPKQFGTEGMSLRKELFLNPADKAISPGYFTSSRKTPMVDIDFPGPYHDPLQTTVRNRKEWAQLLKDYMKTKAGKKSAFKIYDTPAGIRAFDISKAHRGTKPYVWEGPAYELGGDPFYINFAKMKKAYDARVFPKPGRKGDFIAKPLKGLRPRQVIMGEDAIVSRKGWNEMAVHDALIRAIAHNTTKNQKVSVGGLLDLTDLSQLRKAF